MTFSDIVYNDPNKADPTRKLLQEYSLYNRKANKAIDTERKAHPWWTILSGIASSFIPYGLGLWITPTANYMVQKHKEQVVNKQNDYRARLGLEHNSNIPDSGLDLSGVGYSMGSTVSTGLGRDVMPGGEKTLSTMSGDPMGVSNAASFIPVNTGSQNLPTAPQQYEGQQTINVPPSNYWENQGGGISGMYSYTSQGNVQGSPPSYTYRHGGKVEAPSHEEGGAPLLKDGKDTGFEIEGNERIVNDQDWNKIMEFLKKKNNKSALLLLKDIDKRKPKEKKFAGSGDTEYVVEQNPLIAPQSIQPDPQLDFSGVATEQGAQLYNNPSVPFYMMAKGQPLTVAPEVTVTDTQVAAPNQTPVTTETITEKVAPANKFNFDYRNLLGYGYDAARLGMGIEGALTPLPKWQIPQNWSDYMGKAEYLSKQGILPESQAMTKQYADSNYAAAVRDVTNASGGNAAAILANLGKINADRAKTAAELAEVDSKLKAANLRGFEGTLLKDIGMKKDIFNMERDVAEKTKSAGANLMQSSISDLQNRSDMDKFYGEGSYFKQMQDEQLKQGKTLSEIYEKQLDIMKNPEKYPSITANLTEGDKKLIRNEEAIAAAQKIASGKQSGLDKVLAALSTPSLLTKKTSTQKITKK